LVANAPLALQYVEAGGGVAVQGLGRQGALRFSLFDIVRQIKRDVPSLSLNAETVFCQIQEQGHFKFI
jgi:hypothetical protein